MNQQPANNSDNRNRFSRVEYFLGETQPAWDRRTVGYEAIIGGKFWTIEEVEIVSDETYVVRWIES